MARASGAKGVRRSPLLDEADDGQEGHEEPRIQNWRSGVAGASKWSVTILAGTASIWRADIPITTQKILMKSSGSTTAMVMERRVSE